MAAKYTVDVKKSSVASAFHDTDTNFHFFTALVFCISAIRNIFIYFYLCDIWNFKFFAVVF